MSKNAIRESKGDRVFDAANHLLLGLLLIIIIYPLLYIVSASISSSEAVIAGEVWLWPVQPTLDGYMAVFANKMIWSGFMNSFYYAGVGTLINVIVTLLAAYPLSRTDLFGRGFFMLLFVFTMMFSGGLIPTYLVVKALGLLDTRWALIIPTALSVWNMIIARTYFQTTISSELLEAGQMDGCNDYRFLWSIVLPLSGPIIAVIALFYAVGHWNQYFHAMIYLRDESLFPLQLVLRDILIQNEVDFSAMSDAGELVRRQGIRELLKYSLIVVSTLPIMVVYPFVQKYFVKGMMIGSLKG
ncbi:multiple sugar transport system permease protein/putative aldouronate transport system permease protein [Paenibacillus phyllosphaerae]|uniref:Multiple sugar transport system permease protein/putative aldouronate transport system permease protein n=1 Tax=Paenibacillus phyllosphaerae TaxID=274593 RepID=A0A7W5B0K1_9BACL|nr:carbohydrate ABC transporter permease [Paenibacillus phyllosphaerae]MBB3112148.1 multiple sugar transport system permease protein/putative aldouronate transport system permease protein [Paenibacillus phyllosphaerae]